MIQAMASCTGITFIDTRLIGDPLDIEMFKYTGWNLEEPEQKESDDNVIQYMFPENISSPDTVALRRRFDFNSALMRSSSIVSCSNSNRAFIKGAPEKVRELCIGEIPSNYDSVLEEYTKNGYRVIALAHKELSADLS